MESNIERRTIKAGTVVHLNGIPVRVCQPIEAETHRNNWALICDTDIVEVEIVR